jgi:hypothetical protein
MSHWTCLAWVGQGEYGRSTERPFDRCGQPTTIVDPVFGGPVCQAHRRTTAVQTMICCACRQEIEPGRYFEYYEGIRRERKDGTDSVICRPCLLKSIGELLDLLKRVPGDAWDQEDEL